MFYNIDTTYTEWSAAGEKILAICTTYTKDFHRFGAPQARKFWQFAPLTKDFHRFGAPQARKF